MKQKIKTPLLKSFNAYSFISDFSRFTSSLSFAETMAFCLLQDAVPATIFASITVGLMGASHFCNKKQQKLADTLQQDSELQLSDEEIEHYKDLKFM